MEIQSLMGCQKYKEGHIYKCETTFIYIYFIYFIYIYIYIYNNVRQHLVNVAYIYKCEAEFINVGYIYKSEATFVK